MHQDDYICSKLQSRTWASLPTAIPGVGFTFQSQLTDILPVAWLRAPHLKLFWKSQLFLSGPLDQRLTPLRHCLFVQNGISNISQNWEISIKATLNTVGFVLVLAQCERTSTGVYMPLHHRLMHLCLSISPRRFAAAVALEKTAGQQWIYSNNGCKVFVIVCVVAPALVVCSCCSCFSCGSVLLYLYLMIWGAPRPCNRHHQDHWILMILIHVKCLDVFLWGIPASL